MNVLAEELNAVLDGTVAGRLMSQLGRRLYFPNGIVAQSTEAKKAAHNADATIGTAMSGGRPLILSAIADSMPTLGPEQSVGYAPTAGVEKVRMVWKDLIIKKNPLLSPDHISLPVVVPGLTSGLSCMADIFLDESQVMISSDPCWDNYSLIFEERRGGALRGVSFFGPPEGENSGGLDMERIAAAIRKEAKTGTVRIILNFPNNPSGYSPTEKEAEAFAALVLDAAEGGADVLVLCDDAYFGLFYEESIYQASLFSILANLHERVLAVKVDGPIKEDYVWGLRTGFVTFGSRGLGASHYDALITKLMGAIRSSVSCANTPAQYIIIDAMEDPRTPLEKINFQVMLQRRYEAVKNFIREHPHHRVLKPLPFNSGYFMCFRCEGVNAEALRRTLLQNKGIGVVALGKDCLRIAYSGLDEEQIAPVYRTVYDTAAEMLGTAKG
ncbi:MAG: aminotransferase class I/II-fold pyridoxal phosphate-dependent enzyme [Treponema sp.]|jgi:aspartate/methionine/tyrosine aminotransferase|nr:aminotransferase class I/II-fold pyridoxal phosphate-dependent enzyme [Treponema sp.]